MPAARAPKVVMTLLVRNEQEVLVANLAHHLAHGVDLVIAMDHRSEDATPRILEEHAATGRVVALRQDADEYRQFEWVTEMARMACVDHGADWVINGDADEFYLARRGSLKDALAAIPEQYGILDVPVVDFLPRPDDAGFFADRMVARETVSFKPGTGDVLKNVVHRAVPDVVVAGGNHNLVDSPLATVPHAWTPIDCLHFPMRSYAQYEAKVVGGGPTFDPAYHSRVQRGQAVEGPTAPEREAYQVYRRGRLRELYAPRVLDPAAELAGVRDGRIVVDRRLSARLADLAAGRGPAVPPAVEPEQEAMAAWPELPPAAATLRAELLRVLHAEQHWGAGPELARRARRERRLEDRVEQVTARNERLERRLDAVASSRWWSLGRRLRVVQGP